MKLRPMLAGAALLAWVAVPSLANAAAGFATTDVNLRAGPGVDYPVVTTIYAGAPVEIHGCLSDWGWCDTSFGGARGWVAGDYLQAIYQDRRVIVREYAPTIGVPVVSFSFGYWDTHYRNRPFYRDRDTWRARWERRDDRRDRIEDRIEDRVEDRRDDRQDARQDRREDVREERVDERQDARQDRRQDAVQERRDERQDTRQDRRQDAVQERRDERRDTRQENRDERQDRQNCRDAGGNRVQCRQ